jgi:predicted nucleotide-binding protein
MKGQVPFYDPDAPTIFLSYTHSDKPFARQLKTDLLLAGARVWIDEAEIGVGDSLIEKIAQGIDQTDFFAIILSPESVSSPWVKKELEIAMKLQIDGKPIKIMPLLHKSCSLPVFLEGLKYADFSKDYNQAFRELLKPLDLVGITDF